MGIQKLVLNIVLTIESFFLKLVRIKKNRITFISLESNELSSDFLLIYNQLNKDKYDIRLCLIHYHKNLFGQFLYFLNCLKQLYYVYTSHMVIIHDNNYVVSHFKREGVVVLQTWHACGAIKKFGNVIKREYQVANYDYVLATSSYWKRPYSQAFDVLEENVLPIGMPRNDELFDRQQCLDYQNELYNKYPYLKDKKILLYAPTFRGNIYKGFTRIDINIDVIMDQLGEDYVFLYKFHPLLGNVQLSQHERVYNMNHEDTHQLFTICDYLISDYSSVVFDYLILEKPLLFYVPDYQDYIRDVGVFVDIYQLPFPVCSTEEDIVNSLLHYDVSTSDMKETKRLFFDYEDQYSTKRVVEFIDRIINE